MESNSIRAVRLRHLFGTPIRAIPAPGKIVIGPERGVAVEASRDCFKGVGPRPLPGMVSGGANSVAAGGWAEKGGARGGRTEGCMAAGGGPEAAMGRAMVEGAATDAATADGATPREAETGGMAAAGRHGTVNGEGGGAEGFTAGDAADAGAGAEAARLSGARLSGARLSGV